MNHANAAPERHVASDGAFRLMIVDPSPYELLNEVSRIGVIRAEVRRSLAQAALDACLADGLLVRVDDALDVEALSRLRSLNPLLPIIGVAETDQDEAVALANLDSLLDDYLLQSQASVERIAPAFRQARKLRLANAQLFAQRAENERLEDAAMEQRRGLGMLSSLFRGAPVTDRKSVTRTLAWLDQTSLRQSPHRQRCAVADILTAAQQDYDGRILLSGDGEQLMYADARQLARAIAGIGNAFDAADLTIDATNSKRGNVEVCLSIHCGAGYDPHTETAADARSRFQQSAAITASRALQLKACEQLVVDNFGEWRFLGETPERETAIEITLPAWHPLDVFARYGQHLLSVDSPATHLTLLEVRVAAAAAQDNQRLHSLLGPLELAYPISDTKWLLGLNTAPCEIGARIQRLSRDWTGAPATRPLSITPVGRWALAEQSSEMLAMIQTACELGELSIATHPKLLLVRPDASKPTPLDRRLQDAGYAVVATEEQQVGNIIGDYQPDAVVVACEDESNAAVNQDIARSMQAIAKIPVVLMTATAREIQRGLQESVLALDTEEPTAPPEPPATVSDARTASRGAEAKSSV